MRAGHARLGAATREILLGRCAMAARTACRSSTCRYFPRPSAAGQPRGASRDHGRSRRPSRRGPRIEGPRSRRSSPAPTATAQSWRARLQTLSQDAAAMSPTLFHNSVFNASAGYWTIASQSRARSTTVSAGDGSFAAGVLEAATRSRSTSRPVLLVAADMPFPASLASCEVTGEPFACALLLAPRRPMRPRGHAERIRMALREGDALNGNGAIDGSIAAALPRQRGVACLAAARRNCRAASPAMIDVPYLDGCRVELAYAP